MSTSKKPDRLADLTASLAARAAVGGMPPLAAAATNQVATPLRPMKLVDALVPNQSVSLYESDLDLLEQVRGWLS